MTDINSFEDILDMPMDKVEKPKPLPQGNYVFQVAAFKFDKTKPQDGKEATQFVEFTMAVVEALEDVDQEELEASGGITKPDDSAKTMRKEFYITQAALYRLKDFAADVLGLDVTGMSIAETIEAMKFQQFVGNVVHNPAKNDPTTVYANLGVCARFEG